MPVPSEFAIQRAYIYWFCGVPDLRTPGAWKITPAGLPGVITWHTPNGGKRDAFEAKRLKELGVLAGFPDVAHLWGALHLLEFKEPGGGRLSPAQIALHPRLIAAGATVKVVDNLADAKAHAISLGLVVDSKRASG